MREEHANCYSPHKASVCQTPKEERLGQLADCEAGYAGQECGDSGNQGK